MRQFFQFIGVLRQLIAHINSQTKRSFAARNFSTTIKRWTPDKALGGLTAMLKRRRRNNFDEKTKRVRSQSSLLTMLYHPRTPSHRLPP
jgi:hypothetical protein